MAINYKYQFEQWLESEQAKSRNRQKPYPQKTFIGSRGYFHFDKTLSINNKNNLDSLRARLGSKKEIGKWPFLPFIRKDQRNRKYRKLDRDNTGFQRHQDRKALTHIKSRPIMFASHWDACLFAFLNYIIEKYYETELKKRGLAKNVIAYRRGLKMSNVGFAKTAFEYLARISKQNNVSCISLDIHGFFDNIPHVELQKNVEKVIGFKFDPAIKHVFSNLTKYRYVFENEVVKELNDRKIPYQLNKKNKNRYICKIEDYNRYIDNKRFVRKNKKLRGIPQGSPISGLFANIYLLEFDDFICNQLKGINFYQRYSDDILIVCPQGRESEIYDQIKKRLKIGGLKLSGKKTECFSITDGRLVNITKSLEPENTSRRQNVQYLGFEWDGNQVVIRPSTIVRRLRPKNRKLRRIFWIYNKFALKTIDQTGIKRQFQHIRLTIKKKNKSKTKK